MFSKFSRKKSKKSDCSCVNIAVDVKKGDNEIKTVDIECSSHPGICVLDENGFCTKRLNQPHCAVPTEFLDESEEEIEEEENSNMKKVHYLKFDVKDPVRGVELEGKKCKSLWPECGSKKCTRTTRLFFISWDKTRSKLLVALICTFILWVVLYVTITYLTS